MPAVTLREINKDNLREAARLKVAPGQESFVAPNTYSVAQSKFHPNWMPMGIYAGETMVGFLMYGKDEEDLEGSYWLIRLMVDERHQHSGYGRAAMLAVLDRLRALPDCGDILLSYEPNNAGAAALYRQLGFEETGRIEYGEVVVCLPKGKPVPGMQPEKAEGGQGQVDAAGPAGAGTLSGAAPAATLDLPVRDPQTGLFNLSYTRETLERELARANRNLATLGMILVALDGFKRPQPAAEMALLAALGEALQSSVRTEDIACRYSEDTFLLVLPDSSLKITVQRARQVQARLLDLVARQLGASAGQVTVPSAVAFYPTHGETGEKLLRAAGQALERAREEGQGGLEIASQT
jgi:diamine N-acetyltransferase